MFESWFRQPSQTDPRCLTVTRNVTVRNINITISSNSDMCMNRALLSMRFGGLRNFVSSLIDVLNYTRNRVMDHRRVSAVVSNSLRYVSDVTKFNIRGDNGVVVVDATGRESFVHVEVRPGNFTVHMRSGRCMYMLYGALARTY